MSSKQMEQNKNEVKNIEKESLPKLSTFTNITDFENAQRIAISISKSDIVPQAYQNNVSNCLVAIEMAGRMNMSPIFVMQNLDVIKGKPSWRSSFIISAINTCGKFSPLRFKFVGDSGTDSFGCYAHATDLETGEKITGPKITWLMVKDEGWLNKSGSKWKTMPELMFQYRAAAFFGRLYAPEILTGMHTVEENLDVFSQNNTQEKIDNTLEQIEELYNSKSELLTDDDKLHFERIINNKEVPSYGKALKALKNL